ncbi:glycosyltransferase [Catenovulum sp. SM1970]|uniref:glycosyltransferase family 2 protein n=1 Tax=Marinifaba aquimaris TaxID=2741323 RepID=UPI0015723109|nr:glycosyltransferase [Marinifaba aquimaris]NTS78280.1 glycosyltransferase [Marinifaba aquimaris]
MDKPLISVVIPAYNAGQYIEETLQSVFKQDYSNLEILVVNDGSTDNTLEILNKYQDKITIFDIANSGVSYARNFAVEHAKGDWLAFIDADDLWDTDKLSKQYAQLNGNLWSHCNSYYIGEEQSGKVTRAELSELAGGFIFDKLILENFITTSTILIDKQIFIDAGGFDEKLAALEDWKLWLDIAIKHPISYIEQPVAKYRVYQGSTSRKARKMLPLHLAVINSVLGDSDSEIKQKAYIKSYNICSYIAEDASDNKFAFSCAWQAFQLEKSSMKSIKRLLRCLINLVF